MSPAHASSADTTGCPSPEVPDPRAQQMGRRMDRAQTTGTTSRARNSCSSPSTIAFTPTHCAPSNTSDFTCVLVGRW